MAGAQRGLALSTRLVGISASSGGRTPPRAWWALGDGVRQVPVRLARTRIQLLRGDVDAGNDVLAHLTSEKEWVLWSRMLSVDATGLTALRDREGPARDAWRAFCATKKSAAVDSARPSGACSSPGMPHSGGRCRDGDEVICQRAPLGLEFPYHGDPYSTCSRCSTARSPSSAPAGINATKENYASFVGYWGDAAWDTDAVVRARQKLETAGGASAPPGLVKQSAGNDWGRSALFVSRFDAAEPTESRRARIQVALLHCPGRSRWTDHHLLELPVDLLESVSLILFCTHSK
jgi:hypothetical protein